jgi:hypothetical protein
METNARAIWRQQGIASNYNEIIDTFYYAYHPSRTFILFYIFYVSLNFFSMPDAVRSSLAMMRMCMVRRYARFVYTSCDFLPKVYQSFCHAKENGKNA